MFPGALWESPPRKIQEVWEGSGAGLLPELEENGTPITDLVCSTWAATYEVDALDDEGEEAVSCCRLKRGLGWAHRAFDELILPATTVSPLKPGA